MNDPFISVIIPCFNCENTIVRALDSVLTQDIKDFEIIIIDDGSIDNTAKVIKDFITKHPQVKTKYIKQENTGPSAARNKGLECARGKYIAFLDSDDVWHPRKLETQIDMMKKYNALISGSTHRVLNNEYLLDYYKEPVDLSFLRWNWIGWPGILFKTPFSTPSVILHESLKEYSFDKALKRGEDYDLWKRITHSYPALKIGYPLVATFKHNYISDKECLSISPISMQRDLNKSDINMLRSQVYNKTEKGLVFLGFILSQIKFLKRVFVRLFYGIKNKLK